MPEIVTEGSGRDERPGDRAELSVTFRGTGRDRAAAVAALGRAVSGVEPLLARPDLTVAHRRLGVHDEWRGDRVVGCRAEEYLTLRLGDVTALADVLAGLVGAQPAALDGPHWYLAEPADARRVAQRRAVADARDRAEGYAAALDGRLGPLRRLSEAGDGGGVPMMARMARAEAADDLGAAVRSLGLEPEAVRVEVRCTTVWELLT